MSDWELLADILQDHDLTKLRSNIYSKMENQKSLNWNVIDIIHDSAKDWLDNNPYTQREIIQEIIE